MGESMLSIIINWIYITLLVYVSGDFVMQIYWKIMHKKEKTGNFAIIFAGILFTTWYAQIFSIFQGVSLSANIVLVLFCLFYTVINRKRIIRRIKHTYDFYFIENKIKGIITCIFAFTVIISFALSSAGPAKLIDTDWYHAQTIRWIEEYGCVKGVANLFYALGFNNAQHYFDALFSMKPFLGQSLRGSGGFFGVVIFMHGLGRVIQFKSHRKHIADSLALWEIAYSIIITAFYADPYTDTLPNMIILYIMVEWFAMLENKEEDIEKLAFYCMLGVFATVAKTSAVMVVLLAVYPIYLLIREKRKAQIMIFILIGFVISIPYFVTNIITTGYPIYLLTAFDFWELPWKIDPEVLRYSVDNMVQFARMPLGTIEEALNCGLKWIPGWFMRESISHQLLYIAIVIFSLYDMVYIGKDMVCFIKRRIPVSDFWMILPRACNLIGIVYWLFTIPQVKYCWAYLIFPIAVIPVYYWERQEKKSIAVKGLILTACGLLVVYTGFYGLRTLKYMWNGAKNYPLYQADYENHVFHTVEKNGHTFYTRIDDGDIVCGYYIFPYLDNKEQINELVVGEELRDGFYIDKKQ